MFGSLPTSVLFIVVVLYAREAVTQPDYVDQYPEVIVEGMAYYRIWISYKNIPKSMRL